MSLVGSLEDLGLGDILQIISLSGKSGSLLIRSGEGEGQILFDQGRIRTAYVGSGSPSASELLEAAVPGETPSAEGRETLLRDYIERSVLRMFSWTSGEFSFEVGNLTGASGPELFLENGINPQFLALEGARLADERAAGIGPGGPHAATRAVVVADPADEPRRSGSAVDPLADVELESDPPGDAPEDELRPEPMPEPLASETEAAVEPAAAESEARPEAELPPLILIDPDLLVIEWVRSALPGGFPAAHLFQAVDQGVGRIRQYLRRAIAPLVVISCSVPADPMSGASGPADLLQRLQRQAPHMKLLLLEEVGRPVPKELERLNLHQNRLSKPTPTQLADPRASEVRERLGRELAHGLVGAIRPEAPRLARADDSGSAVRELREVSSRLRDPASGGAVLPQVMEFATRIFTRVALFSIRDEEARGIAQVGLPEAGGPDDEGIREVCIHTSESDWLRKVIEHRAPIRTLVGPTPPQGGDAELIACLGEVAPSEAWLAPIESADRVVAVLYADMLPGREPIADTAALEVVLHQAGLALDRAALERALQEPEA